MNPNSDTVHEMTSLCATVAKDDGKRKSNIRKEKKEVVYGSTCRPVRVALPQMPRLFEVHSYVCAVQISQVYEVDGGSRTASPAP